jgi:hypothetical protein
MTTPCSNHSKPKGEKAMAVNILELLKAEFGDEIVGKLGKFVGEDTSRTKTALGSVFPAILGGLVS